MISFWRVHWLAFCISLVVGLVYVSHHFFVPLFLDAGKVSYFPITRQSYYDEAIFYAPRANAVYQNGLVSGDLGVYEYKNSPTVFPILNPMIMGLLAKGLGSFSAALIFSDFLFPAIIFLLLYCICFEITQRKIPSLIFAMLFIFAPKLGIYIPPVTKLNLRGLFESFFPFFNPAKLHFSEFEEPKITFLFFALSFYTALRALRRKDRYVAIIAGLAFGVMFYTYLYDWASFFVALGIAFVLFFIARDWERVKIIAIIVGLGFAMSAYYWFNVWQVYHLPYARDVIARAGGEYSHHFRFLPVWKSYLRHIVLGIFLLATLLKKNHAVNLVLLGFLGAYFVVVNIQVITGFNPFPDHWYRTQFLPLALILFLFFLFLWDRYAFSINPPTFTRGIGSQGKDHDDVHSPSHPFYGWEGSSPWQSRILFWKGGGIKRFGRAAAFIFFIYFFGAFSWSQYSYSKANAEAFVILRARLESMRWLDLHTAGDSVVGSPDFSVNNDIVLHTHNKIFVPTFSVATPANEVWARYMFLADVFGVTPQEFEHALRESGAVYFLFMEQYGDHSFDVSFGNYDRKFPDVLVKQKTEEYARMLRLPQEGLPPGRLDYLYFDANTSSLGQDPQKIIPHLEIVYKENGITIYRYGGTSGN